MPLTPVERIEQSIAKIESKVASLESKIDEATGSRLVKSLESQRDTLLNEIAKLRTQVEGYEKSWNDRVDKAYGDSTSEEDAEDADAEKKSAAKKGKKPAADDDDDSGLDNEPPEEEPGFPCPACQNPLTGEPAMCPRCRSPLRWT